MYELPVIYKWKMSTNQHIQYLTKGNVELTIYMV